MGKGAHEGTDTYMYIHIYMYRYQVQVKVHLLGQIHCKYRYR